MLNAIAAALAVQAAAGTFDPPLDRAIEVRVDEERSAGAAPLRFAVERRVTFRRDGDTLIADVETLRTEGSAGSAARIFEGGMAAMTGRHILVELDREGRIIGVRDRAALWEALVAGMERAAADPAGDPARAATVARLIGQLRAAPPAEQVRQLGDAVAILVVAPGLVPHPARAIRQPVRAADGASAELVGSETIAVAADGRLCLDRVVAGTVGDGATRRTTRRCVDPATRLLATLVETTETRIAERVQTIRRSVTVR